MCQFLLSKAEMLQLSKSGTKKPFDVEKEINILKAKIKKQIASLSKKIGTMNAEVKPLTQVPLQ